METRFRGRRAGRLAATRNRPRRDRAADLVRREGTLRTLLRPPLLVALIVAGVATLANAAAPQEPQKPAPSPPQPAPAASPDAKPAIPPALTEYLGRKIAPTMSYEGGPWLMRAEREKEERCTELLAALHLKEGDVVADVGCGNGFYTWKFAPIVGAKGRIYAIDIQPEMLELLKKEGEARKLGNNVVPVLGTVVDPKLPPASIDLAFLVDVYHEFDHPVEMLAALKKSLKPTGRLVLVEFRLEDPNVPIKLLHRMSKAQMKKELAANGFDVAEEYDELPWQHVMFFKARKDAPGEPKAEGKPAESGEKKRDDGSPTPPAKDGTKDGSARSPAYFTLALDQ